MPQCPCQLRGSQRAQCHLPEPRWEQAELGTQGLRIRGREVPEAPEPLILHQQQLQGQLLTFRATGSDARGLHLHSLQQGAQGLLFIFTDGKKTPHLAAVTPHSQS